MHEQQPQEPTARETARKVEPARPRILVGPAADVRLEDSYWLDAAQPLERLEASVAIIVGPDRAYKIIDAAGFGPLPIGSAEPLPTIAAMASGIVRHGPAFAAWAATVGVTAADERDFRGSYLGSWADFAAFGRQFAADLGLADRLQSPTDLQPYIAFDSEAMVMDMLMRRELQTIEDGRGIVHFFLGPGRATTGGEDA